MHKLVSGTKHGVTIKQLKELLQDTPELDEEGRDNYLWIDEDGAECSSVANIMLRIDGGDLVIGR